MALRWKPDVAHCPYEGMRMLISNTGMDHAEAIAELLDGAEQVVIAVAFLKKGGAIHLATLLEGRLAAGATVELFIGTDFFLTEPEALERLLTLGTRHASCRTMIADRSPATFHPKIYSARQGDEWRTIVGSANLTQGALRSNEELSLLVHHANGDTLTEQLGTTIERYRNWKRFQPLDDLVLQQYRSVHEIDRSERAKYEKARDKALPDGFDLRVIEDWHARYLADPNTAAAQASRRKSRADALRLQRSLAKLSDGAIDDEARGKLRKGLGDLMGSAGGRHLWGSGSIHRQGSKALKHPRKMIRLFALARSASRLPPSDGFKQMREAAAAISGVGMNMATEMLCTFAPGRYAVYNGNTAGALATLGITAAAHADFRAIGPDRYARLCGTIGALGARIGASDMSEADAFLNWIYWKVKTGGA